MSSTTTRSTSALICSALSFAMGAWAFVKTQAVTKETFEPIVEVCTSKNYTSMEDFVEQTGYHAYDKRVGLVAFDFLVCLITQFLHDLTQLYPAGLISWGGVMIVYFPVAVLCNLEAGRQNNKGLILWPTLNGFLMQLLGVSIIFPALWVPAYTWGAGEQGGAVNLTLARLVFFLSLPGALLSVLVFSLETDTPEWTTCAGILGGPVLPLIALVVWILPPPQTVSQQDAAAAAETSAVAYAAAGVASLVAWFYIVYTILTTYGWDFTALCNDLWWDAHPSVAFMTIDAGVLWLGLVLHIGTRNGSQMIQALVGSFFFGPGAACAMALTSLEMDRLANTTPPADPQKKEL